MRTLMMTATLAALALGGCQQPAGLDVPASGYGHAEDYSWLAGRLERVDLEGGFWQVRYAPADSAEAKADSHGGTLTLGNPPVLRGFEAGEWVKITGRLTDRASIHQAGPLYQPITVHRWAGPDAK